MPVSLRSIARELAPPILVRGVRWFFPSSPAAAAAAPAYGFVGDYPSFAEALADSSGYDTAEIATSVASRPLPDETTEIDAFFQQVHSALSFVVHSSQSKRLKVLDVGGARGGHFAVCSRLSPGIQFDWTILETPSMVKVGTPLPVKMTTELPDEAFDVVLASGVLQCLPDPYAFLQKYIGIAPWLILHRVPLISSERDRLTVYRVNPELLPGSMPIWFFSETKIMALLAEKGTIKLRWNSSQESYAQYNGRSAGLLWRRYE